jgi:S1-C subfamily serine protease
MARFHALGAERGVRVVSLEKGSPARKADVEEGDIIVGYDEHFVGGIDDLQRLLTEERVGKDATLAVIRGTEKRLVPIRPEEFPRSGTE